MDLATATDMNDHPITYNTSYGNGYYDGTDVWDSTYNDSESCQFIYTNGARFMLSHIPSMNAYNGMSWEGFTLSKVSQDTANVFGCVANGGLAGEGTPYAIGYFSEWVTESQGFSSNIIFFDQAYYPEYVYICQNSNTMKAITNGVLNARAFTEQDTLSLIISAIDGDGKETQSIIYHLAVDGKKNNGWGKVPLTALGQSAGVSFRMTSTDIGSYGTNTPLYFALDGLTVNTEKPTSVQTIDTNTQANGQMVLINGRLMLMHDRQLYTLLGQRVE
jgi:hypothetical protein